MIPFPAQLKNARRARELTLSLFARNVGQDVVILSKIERGLDPAPSDPAVLGAWADLLGLAGAAREDFMAAAAVSTAQGPGPLPTEAQILAAMPAFPPPSLRDPRNRDGFMNLVRLSLTPTALCRS